MVQASDHPLRARRAHRGRARHDLPAGRDPRRLRRRRAAGGGARELRSAGPPARGLRRRGPDPRRRHPHAPVRRRAGAPGGRGAGAERHPGRGEAGRADGEAAAPHGRGRQPRGGARQAAPPRSSRSSWLIRRVSRALPDPASPRRPGPRARTSIPAGRGSDTGGQGARSKGQQSPPATRPWPSEAKARCPGRASAPPSAEACRGRKAGRRAPPRPAASRADRPPPSRRAEARRAGWRG